MRTKKQLLKKIITLAVIVAFVNPAFAIPAKKGKLKVEGFGNSNFYDENGTHIYDYEAYDMIKSSKNADAISKLKTSRVLWYSALGAYCVGAISVFGGNLIYIEDGYEVNRAKYLYIPGGTLLLGGLITHIISNVYESNSVDLYNKTVSVPISFMYYYDFEQKRNNIGITFKF